MMAEKVQRSLFWKLAVSLVIFLWALVELFPSGVRRGLDLQGGLSVALEVDPRSLTEDQLGRRKQLEQVRDVIRRRLDGMGLVEPQILLRGGNQIEIQLAGVFSRDNPDVLDAIKKPAKLEFRAAYGGPSDPQVPPPGYVRVPWAKGEAEAGPADGLLLRRTPELIGRDVKRAAAIVNQYGGYEIGLELTPEGAKKFERVTAENMGRPLAIVLDGKIYSAPLVRAVIRDGRAAISGHFGQREAVELASVLNNPLEMELRLSEVHELGPTLAEDVRASAVRAASVGSGLVMAFMVAYYGLSGAVAVLSLFLNVAIMLGSMAMLGATLTLPGIAALVLSVGMAVDSNILIFARMGEEWAEGKSPALAFETGFRRAFSAIFDANVTTLLTAAILIAYGAGPIRGFGIVLAIGVLATLFCTLVFCDGALKFLVHRCRVKSLLPSWVRGSGKAHFPFHRWTRPAFLLAAVAILAGMGAIVLRGKNIYGIDFTGGDELLLSFRERPALRELHSLAARNGIGEIQAVFQRPLDGDGEQLNVRTTVQKGGKFFQLAKEELSGAELQLLRLTSIGGNVSASIRRNAAVALLLALGGILAYVAVRFEIGFGMGAFLSTIHDVLATVGIYVLLGHRFSAPMVAAVLMIVGYSINDTIVVFDRIREELPRNPSLSLTQVVDLALNKTLSRTLLTSLTVLTASLSLWLLGAGSMVDIAFIFTIGVVVGTFSSIFIASPIFLRWHRGRRENLGRI
ncbi:MAG: protein translocase subunit SecD [Puniceicoccales bacterium]|jgi:SecD/SecF fusion protein|nr:protein translocase subunit SecD [Puniceicoccales bacterium]